MILCFSNFAQLTYPICLLHRIYGIVLQRLGQMSEELSHTKVQLKQQPASTHTMQAIMEAKVAL